MAAGCDKLNQQKMLDARCSMLDARYNDKSESFHEFFDSLKLLR
jgi:hypothetical protein